MTLFEIDPNVVKPGWTPLLVIIGIACVMVVLYLSMRRQFKKINVPSDETPASTTEDGHTGADEVRPASPPSDADDALADITGRSKPDAGQR